MKVSIVMLLSGKEKRDRRTISSILDQTFKNIELILMDIGRESQNTDLLNEIMAGDDRVKVCKGDKDLRSANQGFLAATGNYFMQISSDIILMPDTVERIMHIFQRRKNIDFVYADAFFYDQKECVHEEMSYLNDEIERFYLYHPARVCFVYKRKVHKILEGYRENCIYDMNNDFWIRAIEAGFSMYHIKGRIYYCILSQRILSFSDRNKLVDARIKICKRTVGLCNISIKRKMLESIIEQCRRYKRYKEGILFTLYLETVKSLFFISGARKDKIIEDSRVSFDFMADTYEQEQGLKEVRKCYAPVLDFVKSYASNDITLLDVGCGTGVMLKQITEIFPSAKAIHGIDLSPMMVEMANENLQNTKAHVEEGTLETLNLSKNFYNIILCMHSFHHYPEPLASLRQMYSILRKEGTLVIADNYYHGWKRIKRNIDLYKNNYPLGDMWMYSIGELCILTWIAGFKRQEYQEVGGSFIFTCRKI